MLALAVASLLFSQQAPANLPARPESKASVEFVKAAEDGDLEKLRAVGSRANVVWAGEDSRTALVVAGHKGRKTVFAEIIAIANANLKREVARLPIEGQPAVVPSMSALQNRIDLFNRPDTDGKTPLMLAASQGWEDLARALIDGGAKPDARDKSGSSAADYAKTAGFSSLADFLNNAPTTVP